MKYNIEIEIDDKVIKESGMEPAEYIRQEMGWLEDSSIRLTGIQEQLDKPEPLTASLSDGKASYKGIVLLFVSRVCKRPWILRDSAYAELLCNLHMLIFSHHARMRA